MVEALGHLRHRRRRLCFEALETAVIVDVLPESVFFRWCAEPTREEKGTWLRSTGASGWSTSIARPRDAAAADKEKGTRSAASLVRSGQISQTNTRISISYSICSNQWLFTLSLIRFSTNKHSLTWKRVYGRWLNLVLCQISSLKTQSFSFFLV